MRIFVVARREYLNAVRARHFAWLTVLAPFAMLAITLVPMLIAGWMVGEHRLVLVDQTGRLAPLFAEEVQQANRAAAPRRGLPDPTELFSTRNAKLSVTYASGSDPAESLAGLRRGEADGVLIVPASFLGGAPAAYVLRTEDEGAVHAVEAALRRAGTRLALADRGVGAVDFAGIERAASLETSIEGALAGASGAKRNLALGFGFATLLLVPMLVFGQSVLAGIVQEKHDRVVEILLASVSPLTLLAGKVVGLAGVALTQITVWIVVLAGARFVAGDLGGGGEDVAAFLRPDVALHFAIFFLLGYLFHVSVYAMAGSLATSQREAQQLLMPVTTLLTAQWFLVFPVLMHPDGTVATTLSMVPPFAPTLMFVRTLVSRVPTWQLALSIALTAATGCLLFAAAARVFRVGALANGARPTYSEIWKRVTS